jgi:hypothetical protein
MSTGEHNSKGYPYLDKGMRKVRSGGVGNHSRNNHVRLFRRKQAAELGLAGPAHARGTRSANLTHVLQRCFKLQGSGPGACERTSVGRKPAKPSARDLTTVSRRYLMHTAVGRAAAVNANKTQE